MSTPSASPPAPAVPAAARAGVADLADPRHGLATRVTEHLHDLIDGLPAPEDEPAAFRETERCCQAHLEQVTRLLVAGETASALVVPQAAVEHARTFIRRRLPLTELLRVYRVGHRFAQEAILDAIGRRVDDPGTREASARAIATFLFEYFDHATTRVCDVYETERASWQRSAVAVRSQTVRDVLDGAHIDDVFAESRLGYLLRTNHLGGLLESVAEHHSSATIDDLEEAAGAIAERLGASRVLFVPAGTAAGWAWWAFPEPVDDELLRRFEGVEVDEQHRIAIGRPGSGPDGFRATHEEALSAGRFADRLAVGSRHAVTSYRAIELVSLLAEDAARAARFARAQLGPLADDTPQAEELRKTVLAYLQHHRSPTTAAGVLHMHKNTVYQRVARVEKMLGRRSADWGIEFEAALTLFDRTTAL